MLACQSCSNKGLSQQVSYYRKQEEQALYLEVWTFKEDIAAGKKVKRADLERKKVWVSETDNIGILTDIRQIAGKKVKSALKKGAVVRESLLSRD